MGFGDTRPTSNWLIAFLVASVAWRAICPLAAFAGTVQDIRDRARLIVAVYKDFAPFSDDGQGIDVDVGKALAEKLGGQRSRLVMRDFLGREWIRETDGKLELTLVGRAALRRYLGDK